MTRQEVIDMLTPLAESDSRVFTYGDGNSFCDYDECGEDCEEHVGSNMQTEIRCSMEHDYKSCKIWLGSTGGHYIYLDTEDRRIYSYDENNEQASVIISRELADDIDVNIEDMWASSG